VAAAGVLGNKKSTPLIKVVAGLRAVFLLIVGVSMADLQRATTSEPHGRCICRNARISPTKRLTSFFPPFSCASVRKPAVMYQRSRSGSALEQA